MKSGDLLYIVQQFLPHVKRVHTTRIDKGLINKTYLVSTEERKDKKYILQALNTKVFTNYQAVMYNIDLVNSHIAHEIKKNPGCSYHNLFFYKTTSGNLLYQNPSDNSFWRLLDYMDFVNMGQDSGASEAGRILGVFHRLLSNLDASRLQLTLPGFHDIEKYYYSYTSVLKQKGKRQLETQKTQSKISAYHFLIEKYKTLKNKSILPIRVVHNDPKTDNILFDKNEKALGLIDWDTIMPGYITTDFGDAIRSLCNTASENCKNLENVSFDLQRYQDFTQAYIVETSLFLIKEEKNNLAFFALLITLEQAIRFFTDYLQYDVYYKTGYPEHNLQRAKVQLKLLDAMYENYDRMQI